MSSHAEHPVIEAGERMLKGSLRKARSRARKPARDPYVIALSKDMLSREDDRVKACAKILRIQRDLFDRDAPDEYLEDFWKTGLAITRAWRREREQQRARQQPMTAAEVREEFARLHLAETEAQGARETAEVELAHHYSAATLVRFLEAQARYEMADQALVEFARAQQVHLETTPAGRVTVIRSRVQGATATGH